MGETLIDVYFCQNAFFRGWIFTDYFLTKPFKRVVIKNKTFFVFYLKIKCSVLSWVQSKLEVKKESGESTPPEAACLCAPPAPKNQCASCGMDIQDRYLLKARHKRYFKHHLKHEGGFNPHYSISVFLFLFKWGLVLLFLSSVNT